MTPAIRNISIGLLLASTAAVALHADWTPQARGAQATATETKKVKGGAQPWPDAKTIESHRDAAEHRKLFTSDESIPITLTADFHTINNDKNVNGTKVYQGSIRFAGPDGQPKEVNITLTPRGHSRRAICNWVPLRLTFPKEPMKGTVFEGIDSIKLGVHCRSDVDDIIAREYVAYRIDNLLTPNSFRARMATATYVDVKSKKPMEENKLAMFIEDDDDVARRMSGRITDAEGLRFTSVDLDTITQALIFEYMISNHDISLFAQHNFRVVEMPTGTKYAVPYDFDYSGLVNAPYAIPPAVLHIDTVRNRVYRGPCRPATELDPILAKFTEIKPKVMDLYDTLPNLKNGYRSEAKKYLDDFYKTIENPGSVKKTFTDCKNTGM
jgi:hypothetical protein